MDSLSLPTCFWSHSDAGLRLRGSGVELRSWIVQRSMSIWDGRILEHRSSGVVLSGSGVLASSMIEVLGVGG